MKDEIHAKVIRIQADKLNKAIGNPEGTFIDRKTIDLIAEADVRGIIVVNGKEIQMNMHLKGTADILRKKIDGTWAIGR